MAPTENVAADGNDGSEANMGIVHAKEGTNMSLEVSIVSGVIIVSVRASADAGEMVSSVGSKHRIFILLINPTPASTPLRLKKCSSISFCAAVALMYLHT